MADNNLDRRRGDNKRRKPRTGASSSVGYRRVSRRLQPEASTSAGLSCRAIDDLVDAIFSTLPRGYWWKLLPNNNSTSDYNVCIGTGRPWEHLLPLLLEGGYLEVSRMGSSLTDLDVKRDAFDSLVDRLKIRLGERVELGTYRQVDSAGGWNALYIHIGAPFYMWRSPFHQIKKKRKPRNLELITLDPSITRQIESTIRRQELNSRMETIRQQYGRKIDSELLIKKLTELIGPIDKQELLEFEIKVEFEPDDVESADVDGVEMEVEVEVVPSAPPVGAYLPSPPPHPPAAAAAAAPAVVTPPQQVAPNDERVLEDAAIEFMLDKREREIQ